VLREQSRDVQRESGELRPLCLGSKALLSSRAEGALFITKFPETKPLGLWNCSLGLSEMLNWGPQR
jgi:hypothetical protein